ncbi:ABC transporter substrate-binding protein [Desulfococcaceae bacterium HSG9]|nr:ABC transporter substrate-binding protein [Desulfococcaceae bacterium HSG9]
MRKTKWVVAIVLIPVLLASPAYAKEQLKPLTIQLNWVTNVQFAGVLLAKKRGWYEATGIDLTVRGWKKGVAAVDEVVVGKAQIGVTEGADIIKARSKGNKIRAVATQFQKAPFCLVSKKNLGIETPEQLTQKKIGTNTAAAILMTKIVLADAGLKYNEITPVKVGWDIQVLLDDKIDVYLGYINNEPLSMKEKGYEANVIPAFKYGYDFYSEVYFVTDTMIQKYPDLIQAFLNVTMRGWREAFKTPKATAEMIVAEYYPKGSVSQQTESLKIFHTLATVGTAVGDNMIGIMDKDYWQKGVDILLKFKQIEKKIPAEDLFTLKFVQKTFTSK